MKKFIPHPSSDQQRWVYMYLNDAVTLESAIRLMEKSCWCITQNTKEKLLACGDDKSKAMLEALNDFQSKAAVKGKPKRFLKLMVERDFRMWEAAESMNISLETAKKYMGLLRNYFKCETTVALVHRAMKEGFLDE